MGELGKNHKRVIDDTGSVAKIPAKFPTSSNQVTQFYRRVSVDNNSGTPIEPPQSQFARDIELLKRRTDIAFEDVGKKSDARIREIEEKVREVDSKQINIIETLGIFVALFTFASVEFQVFKIYQTPEEIAGLTLIFLGSLLTFVTVLDFVLSVRLPIRKVEAVEGTMSNVLAQVNRTIGYTKEVEFSWLRPDSWGPAITVKFMPLMVLWAILISSGVYLFVSADKEDTMRDIFRADNQNTNIYLQKVK